MKKQNFAAGIALLKAVAARARRWASRPWGGNRGRKCAFVRTVLFKTGRAWRLHESCLWNGALILNAFFTARGLLCGPSQNAAIYIRTDGGEYAQQAAAVLKFFLKGELRL
jgi:hypothetical protein